MSEFRQIWFVNTIKTNTPVKCFNNVFGIAEGENNEEPICKTTEVEILPSIDFCKLC